MSHPSRLQRHRKARKESITIIDYDTPQPNRPGTGAVIMPSGPALLAMHSLGVLTLRGASLALLASWHKERREALGRRQAPVALYRTS